MFRLPLVNHIQNFLRSLLRGQRVATTFFLKDSGRFFIIVVIIFTMVLTLAYQTIYLRFKLDKPPSKYQNDDFLITLCGMSVINISHFNLGNFKMAHPNLFLAGKDHFHYIFL